MGENCNFIKHTRNPAFGLIPMFVFTVLIYFLDISISALIGIALSFAGTVLIKRHSRMLYDISGITFLVSIGLYLLYPSLDVFSKFVITEIVFVTVLIVSRLTRTKVIHRLARSDKLEVRNYLSESFRVGFQIQYALFLHLLLVLFFLLIAEVRITLLDVTHLLVIVQILLVGIIALETMRLHILDKKLKMEEWLPVVNESGDVTGRVAKSVTQQMKNNYLHPVVRIALINKGKIYLTRRSDERILNPGMLDYPFEKYMYYNHNIEETIKNSIRTATRKKNIPLQFILKYVFENDNTKRLILLYVSVVDSEDAFNKLKLPDGKLWTISQIEENMGMSVFSESFELEFEYLKNTVLLSYLSGSNGA